MRTVSRCPGPGANVGAPRARVGRWAKKRRVRHGPWAERERGREVAGSYPPVAHEHTLAVAHLASWPPGSCRNGMARLPAHPPPRPRARKVVGSRFSRRDRNAPRLRNGPRARSAISSGRRNPGDGGLAPARPRPHGQVNREAAFDDEPPSWGWAARDGLGQGVLAARGGPSRARSLAPRLQSSLVPIPRWQSAAAKANARTRARSMASGGSGGRHTRLRPAETGLALDRR